MNIYGVVPTSNTQYINAVLGLSALRFDNRYLGGLSGERNGKQVFGTINYRTKTAYSKFNITPTGKFTYGVTQLSEFTDFIAILLMAQLRMLDIKKTLSKVENLLVVFYSKWKNMCLIKELSNRWEELK